jgi:hypothetical protein
VCNSPATLCHPRRSQDPLLSDAFAVGVVIFGQLGASSMSSPWGKDGKDMERHQDHSDLVPDSKSCGGSLGHAESCT